MKINKVKEKNVLQVMKEGKSSLFWGNVDTQYPYKHPREVQFMSEWLSLNLELVMLKIIHSQKLLGCDSCPSLCRPTEGAAVGGTDFLPPQMAALEHPGMHMDGSAGPCAGNTCGGSAAINLNSLNVQTIIFELFNLNTKGQTAFRHSYQNFLEFIKVAKA